MADRLQGRLATVYTCWDCHHRIEEESAVGSGDCIELSCGYDTSSLEDARVIEATFPIPDWCPLPLADAPVELDAVDRRE